METEPEIKEIKVKERYCCVKCGEEMKKLSLGGDGLFSLGGTGAFYCNDTKCKMFGYLTVGVRKVVEEKD